MRLIQIAEHYWWEIDGQVALSGGVELTRLPFRRFLLAILAWARPVHKEEETQRFDDWLASPFPGVDPDRVSPEVIDDELAAFSAFKSQAKGGGK